MPTGVLDGLSDSDFDPQPSQPQSGQALEGLSDSDFDQPSAPKPDIRSLAKKRKQTLLSAAPDDGSLANELEFNQTQLPRSTSQTGSLYSDRTAADRAPVTSDSSHGPLPPAVVNTLTDPFHRLSSQYRRSSGIASEYAGALGKKIADTVVPADKPLPQGDSYQARKDALAVARENELAALLRGVTEKGLGSAPTAAEWGLATASGAALPATVRAIVVGLTGAYFGGEGVRGVLDAAPRVAALRKDSSQQERADAYGDLAMSLATGLAPLHAKATVAKELAAGRPGPEPGGQVSPPDDLADMQQLLRQPQEPPPPVPHPVPDIPLDPRQTVVPERLTSPVDIAPSIQPPDAAGKIGSIRDQREALSALLSQTTSLSARQKIRAKLEALDQAEAATTGGALAVPQDQLAAQYLAEEAKQAQPDADQGPGLPEFPGESPDALLANAAQALQKQQAPLPSAGPADTFAGKQGLERRLSRVDPDQALASVLGMDPSELPGAKPPEAGPAPKPLSVPSLADRKLVREAGKTLPIEGRPAPAEAPAAVLSDQEAMMAELNAAIAENNRLKAQLAERQKAPAQENPAPESKKTIDAQVGMLDEGRKAAVLIPEQTGQPAPEPPPGKAALKTEAGTILYDPAKIDASELTESAKTGVGLGEKLFGEGVPDRPAAENPPVVSLRSPEGLELQSAAAEPADVTKVQQAFGRIAKPGESVTVAPEKAIVKERLTPPDERPVDRPSLVDELKSYVDERGAFTRGTSVMRGLLADRSTPELVDALRWTRSNDASPFVNRFGGSEIATELRQRGVPVDEIEWQMRNVPREEAAAPPDLPEDHAPVGVRPTEEIPDTSARETGRSAREWADELTRLRGTKPRPINKLYGKRGPTPEQKAQWDADMKAWNAANRKASIAHKRQLPLDNEKFRAWQESKNAALTRPEAPTTAEGAPEEGPLARRRREQLETRLAALREKYGRAKSEAERDVLDDKVEQTSLDLEGEHSGPMPPEMAKGFEDWKQRALPSLEPTLRQIAGEGSEGLSGDALIEKAREGIGLESAQKPGKLLRLKKPKGASEKASAGPEPALKAADGPVPSAVPEEKLIGHIPLDRVMEIKRAQAQAEGSKFQPALRDNGDGSYSLVTLKDGKRVAGKPFRPLSEAVEGSTPLRAGEPTEAGSAGGKRTTVYRSMTLGSGLGALGEHPGEVIGRGLEGLRAFANDPGNVLETKPANAPKTTAEAALDAHIASGRTTAPWSIDRLKRMLKTAYQKVVRGIEPLQAYDDTVKPERPTHEKASELAKLSSDTRVETAIEHGPLEWQPDGSIVHRTDVKPIAEVWSKLGGLVQDTRRYMVAKRGIELADRERTRALADEKYVPKSFEELTGLPFGEETARELVDSARDKVRDAAQRTSDWLNTGLDYWKQAGGLSPEMERALREFGKSYVSFERIFGSDEAPSGLKKATLKASLPFKRLVGSERRIADPFLTTIDHYTRMIRAADQNRVARAMIQSALDSPEAARAAGVEAVEPLESKAHPAVQRIMAEAAKHGIEIGDKVASELAEAMGQKLSIKDNVLSAYMGDGTLKAVRVSPEIAEAFKSMQPEALSAGVKLLGLLGQTFKWGVVNNPFFWARNMWRDTTERITKNKGEPGEILPSGREILKAVPRTFDGLVESFKDGPLRQEWLASGAGYSGLLGSPSSVKATVRGLLPKTLGQKVITAMNPLEWKRAVEHIGERFEEAGRLASFKEAKERGAKTIEAGVKSSEATTNFKMRGSSGFVRGANHTVPFLSPAIAATDQLFRTAGGEAMVRALRQGKTVGEAIKAAGPDAGKLVSRATVFIVAPTLLRYYRNRNDKEIEDLRKSTNGLMWNYDRIGGDDGPILRTPRSHLLELTFGAGVEATLDTLREKDPKEFARFMDQFGSLAGQNAIPHVAKQWEQISANKDDFGRPIVPPHLTKLDGGDPELLQDQYSDRTSRFSRRLGEVTSKIGILPSVVKSPARLDYLINQNLGTAGSTMTDMADRAFFRKNEEEGPAPSPRLGDLTSGFFARIPSASGYESQKFYDGLKRAEAAAASMKVVEGMRDQSKAQARAEKLAPLADMADRYAEANQAIAELRGQMRSIASDPSITDPKEKRKRIDDLTREINSIFRQVNEETASLREARPPAQQPSVPFS